MMDHKQNKRQENKEMGYQMRREFRGLGYTTTITYNARFMD